MNTPAGIDPQMIANPPHYVKGRKIEPIQVIEEWSFCHHLGCVVKYVARIGRKNPILEQTRLEDLKKAEWYLMREIGTKACTRIPNPRRFSTAGETVAKDWQLSPSLSRVIFCLTSYQRLFHRLSFSKTVFLEQALTHLRAEIRRQESGARNQDQQQGVREANVIIFKRRKP